MGDATCARSPKKLAGSLSSSFESPGGDPGPAGKRAPAAPAGAKPAARKRKSA